MSEAENEHIIVQRWTEEMWNRNNLALLDAILAPTFLRNGTETTREAYQQLVVMWRTAFPDTRFTLDEVISKDDNVVVRVTFRGTHLGQLGAFLPTGNVVTLDFIEIYRLAQPIGH